MPKVMVDDSGRQGIILWGGRVLFCVEGGQDALGFRSMAADLGSNLSIKLVTDRAAALGIIGRRCLNKIRRMETG